jgi:hypothetical protein
MRLRSDIWVSAFLRRAEIEGAFAVLRKRGSAEAGAIFIRLDRLDGTVALYGPAPQSEMEADDPTRRFRRMHEAEWTDALSLEDRLKREMKFDPDLWIVDLEDRQGRHFLDDALID